MAYIQGQNQEQLFSEHKSAYNELQFYTQSNDATGANGHQGYQGTSMDIKKSVSTARRTSFFYFFEK